MPTHPHITHAHTRSFSRETVQPAFLKPSHPLPPTPSLTLLLPRLQAVAPQDGQARSGPGRLTWMTTQSDEEPLPILPGNRERSSTTKASDTSLSGYVRRCGRKGQPPTMRYVVTGVSCMPPPACLHITVFLVEVSNLRVRSKLLLMFELHVFSFNCRLRHDILIEAPPFIRYTYMYCTNIWDQFKPHPS